ncbi:FUSC family protein, partial [Streptomyces sp. SID7499]|nr:FUSC family protein [Streptomyces sp. SID7499]
LLDDCVTEVRGLASIAADPDASHDARLSAACSRVEAAVEILTAPRPGTVPAVPVQPHRPTATEPALAHLHGLERALAQLVSPLSHAPYAASTHA